VHLDVGLRSNEDSRSCGNYRADGLRGVEALGGVRGRHADVQHDQVRDVPRAPAPSARRRRSPRQPTTSKGGRSSGGAMPSRTSRSSSAIATKRKWFAWRGAAMCAVARSAAGRSLGSVSRLSSIVARNAPRCSKRPRTSARTASSSTRTFELVHVGDRGPVGPGRRHRLRDGHRTRAPRPAISRSRGSSRRTDDSVVTEVRMIDKDRNRCQRPTACGLYPQTPANRIVEWRRLTFDPVGGGAASAALDGGWRPEQSALRRVAELVSLARRLPEAGIPALVHRGGSATSSTATWSGPSPASGRTAPRPFLASRGVAPDRLAPGTNVRPPPPPPPEPVIEQSVPHRQAGPG
jgi:hypothetical protein